MAKFKIHFKDRAGPVCGSLGGGVSDIARVKEVTCLKCQKHLRGWGMVLAEFHQFVRETISEPERDAETRAVG